MGVPADGGVDHVVDLDRYPLLDPEDPRWAELVSKVRAELAEDGCCVLADFVRPSRREQLRREGADVAPLAHDDLATVNVYNTAPDPTLPADHPARVAMQRGNAFVARDRIPDRAIVTLLHTDPRFQRFVAACFGLDRVHELADPLAGLCLNVLAPGREHPWHFDTNEFTVSLLTQVPEAGGEFEYCPQIRTAESENLSAVRAVLDGRGEHLVRRLHLRPGDLQLFRGRYALHRVREVAGATARHTAILAYTERPGVVSTAERTRQLFGRLAPVHTANPAVRVDQLLD
jgi:hypothetical protein